MSDGFWHALGFLRIVALAQDGAHAAGTKAELERSHREAPAFVAIAEALGRACQEHVAICARYWMPVFILRDGKLEYSR